MTYQPKVGDKVWVVPLKQGDEIIGYLFQKREGYSNPDELQPVNTTGIKIEVHEYFHPVDTTNTGKNNRIVKPTLGAE